VAVTSAVFSWGYHYVYEASAFKDSMTTPTGQFQDFLATAIGLLGLGLVPAIIAVLIQITGTHRSWRRIVAATVIPNVIGGVGMAFIVYGGGLGTLAVQIALIVTGIGSVTFFIALAWPRWDRRHRTQGAGQGRTVEELDE
jgi:hypothetical protein